MPAQRIFLDWDKPCLQHAAQWLIAQGQGPDQSVALGDWLIVVPGGRSGRRLLEMLAQQTRGMALTPPTILTVSQLPEHLYRCQPGAPALATDVQALLARLAAVQKTPKTLMKQWIGREVAPDDLPTQLMLAQQLESLDSLLRGHEYTFSAVGAKLDQELADFTDHPRWQAMAQIQSQYHQLLELQNLVDVHTMRRKALNENGWLPDLRVALLAVHELPPLFQRMLEQSGADIASLIYAPARLADRFDELGLPIAAAWQEQMLDLSDVPIHVTDRPRDQALTVARLLAQAPIQPDNVTLGVADPAEAGALERALGLCNIPARSAAGAPWLQSRPAKLLRGLTRVLARQRLDDFAALLRHPDLQRYLEHERGEAISLTQLDDYLAEHLQSDLRQTWLGPREQATQLRKLHESVMQLVPQDHARPHHPSHWAGGISELLSRVYSAAELYHHDADDAQLARALSLLGQMLRDLAKVSHDGDAPVKLTLSQTIDLTLTMLAQQPIAEAGGEPSVELLGWLELLLDDAPTLLITSFNEGLVPQSLDADPFLPDTVRRVLGLPDNVQRYARDLMLTTAIVRSRPSVTILTTRTGSDENPRVPSRLLLACEPKQQLARIEQFYAEESDRAPQLLLEPGEQSLFTIPRPQAIDAPITRLRVTAFRDYLACPYRFYLKHIKRLTAKDDRAQEMAANAFGSLAHDVLSAFGRSDAADSADAKSIFNFLQHELERICELRYGPQPVAAVVLQREQLRRRLEAFANWQAQQRSDGWRVLSDTVETSMDCELLVDEEPFGLTGRIDRIDMHPELGHRIIDYKTSDTAKDPEKQHRQRRDGEMTWVDLQLPLYRYMVQRTGITDPIALGYVQLPKDLTQVGFTGVSWDEAELDEAVELARQVVRNIRNGVFWQPAEPASYEDELSPICMDRYLRRQEVIGGAP